MLVLFLYSYNATACLEVAIVNSLEVRRYLTVQMFFTTVAQFFALWLLCEVVLEMRARRLVRVIFRPGERRGHPSIGNDE